jgi:hypothetical protein
MIDKVAVLGDGLMAASFSLPEFLDGDGMPNKLR